MDLAELISASRSYLACFDYDHYPACFQAFGQDCSPILAALEGSALESAAAQLIDTLERRRAELPRRVQKAAAKEEKQVLALFLAPTAERLGGTSADFVQILCRQWNARYPRNTFLAGNYETIMKGFDANLLGLPLRKSSKRNRGGAGNV